MRSAKLTGSSTRFGPRGLFLAVLLAIPLLAAPERAGKVPSTDPKPPADANHAAMPESKLAELGRFTGTVSGELPQGPQAPVRVNNYIDEFIFRKLRDDGIPHAGLCSDFEFIRRVSLDLTGRLPEPEQIRSFVSDADPAKRDKLVDSLMAVSMKGVTKKPSSPFLHRWTYFFSDLFRINNLMSRGRTLLHEEIYNALATNQPYDEFVRGLLTSTARSNFNSAAVNFLVRFYVDQPDQSTVNPEDTYDELAIRTARMFLGINLECISCHDGQRHLEKINLWLTEKKRADLWRQSAFFGKVRLYRPYGDLVDEFVLSNDGKGYDTASKSVVRLPRYKADTTPTFILTGEHPKPGEDPREAYARMLTGHIQFARTTVNLIWAELFGAGIVDPPADFDLVRYGPNARPPTPWTPQAVHAELLDKLAQDFQAHHFDLRYLIRLMATSSAYQLSHRVEGPWKPEYAGYFGRRLVRRLPAEEIWDGISQATGVFDEITAGDFGAKVKYAIETVSPEDFDPKLRKFLASFGIDDRTLGLRSLGASVVQVSNLMNSDLVKRKLKVEANGRLAALMNADPPKKNSEIVEELFLVALARFPSPEERNVGIELLAENHARGAEDLLWILINKPEFALNY